MPTIADVKSAIDQAEADRSAVATAEDAHARAVDAAAQAAQAEASAKSDLERAIQRSLDSDQQALDLAMQVFSHADRQEDPATILAFAPVDAAMAESDKSGA